MTREHTATPSLLEFSSTRERLRRLVDADSGEVNDQSAPAGSAPLSGRERERALVDAWREAHWTLRLTLDEVARERPALRLGEQYDAARRCDNLLNEYYQARADVLLRQVRDLTGAHASEPPVPAERVTATERALLARVRGLSADDRAAVMRLAVQLSTRGQRL